MPWTYSRWARTFGLIRDDMPPERRKAWTDALLLGFTGISDTQLRHVHNIPTHHAMGLYAAGKALDRPDWCRQAAEFMQKVVAEQSSAGYWSEGGGNTKLQPAWSSFTVGDMSLLSHKPGDVNPDFLPKGELYHVPSAAMLFVEPHFGLDLTYGKEICRVRINPLDERTLECS